MNSTILIGVGCSPVIDLVNQLVAIPPIDTHIFLLLEDGFNLLLEDGGRVELETIFVLDELSNNIVDEFNNILIG